MENKHLRFQSTLEIKQIENNIAISKGTVVQFKEFGNGEGVNQTLSPDWKVEQSLPISILLMHYITH
jgi:hypothetical protein